MDPIITGVLSKVIATVSDEIKSVLVKQVRYLLGFDDGVQDKPDILTKTQFFEQINLLRARLDEDRIAKLYAGVSQLKQASRSTMRIYLFQNALASFYEIANIPNYGTTAGFPNGHLRGLAFLGIAAIQSEVGDQQDEILCNIIQAILADRALSVQIFGEDITFGLLSNIQSFPLSIQLPITPIWADIAFSPDSNLLATGISFKEKSYSYSYKYSLFITNLIAGETYRIPNYECWEIGSSIAFSPIGGVIACASYSYDSPKSSEQTILGFWNLSARKWERVLKFDGSRPKSLIYTSNGESIIFADIFNIYVFDANSGEQKQKLSIMDYKSPYAALSNDNASLACIGRDVVLFQPLSRSSKYSGRFDRKFKPSKGDWNDIQSSCKFFSDNKKFASLTSWDNIGLENLIDRGKILLWSIEDKGKLKPFYYPEKSSEPFMQGFGSQENVITLAPKDSYIVSGGSQGDIRFWDPITGKLKHAFQGHEKGIIGLTYSPDGFTFASIGKEGCIRTRLVNINSSQIIERGEYKELPSPDLPKEI